MTATASVPVGAAIPSLARWGLTSDADLAFRTLATFGARTARGLGSELGMPRRRVESALSELLDCGAAAPVPGQRPADRRSWVWASRPAAEVVHTLRMRRLRQPDPEAAARRHAAVVQLLNDRLTGIGLPVRPSVSGPVTDGIRYLPSAELTRQRLAAAMAGERYDHLVINNEDDVNPADTRATPLNARRRASGVTYQVIGRPPLDGDGTIPDLDVERRIQGSDFLYRESLDTPLKLFICDRRVAFLPARPGGGSGYFEITRPETVGQLVTLFEARWGTAVDPLVDGVPMIVLSDRERGLIELLAAGHTDVTAAREMLISARSVTNTLRALMDRLGVDNRFQLGLALGSMGVTVPPASEAAAG
jgi:DNA-binding CsgD family transcriptional regulator